MDGTVRRGSPGGDLEVATLGGGCFWCLEPAFEELRGVRRVVVGYSGGDVPNPGYREVCSGRTGHAEVVQVAFDPEEIDYRTILEVFFTLHDPTQRNRQGPDVGPQYRSAIFHHGRRQREVAEEVIAELGEELEDPVVTEVAPFEAFYPAEEEHQAYYRRHPERMYCRAIIRPKLSKFRKRISRELRREPGAAGG